MAILAGVFAIIWLFGFIVTLVVTTLRGEYQVPWVLWLLMCFFGWPFISPFSGSDRED